MEIFFYQNPFTWNRRREIIEIIHSRTPRGEEIVMPEKSVTFVREKEQIDVSAAEMNKKRVLEISLHELVTITDLAKGYTANNPGVPPEAVEIANKFWNLVDEWIDNTVR
jgi:hypothetical protein